MPVPPPPNNIALIRDTTGLQQFQVEWAAAAIQQQLSSPEFAQWNVPTGTVTAFERDDQIPNDSFPVYIQDTFPYSGIEGFHMTQSGTGLPYANVKSDGKWSITASHEILEMVLDPTGNKLWPGPSLQPGQGDVQYLLEICDPMNDPANAIQGTYVKVSDFLLPGYFDLNSPSANCTANGRTTPLLRPMEILPGGYLTWIYQNQWYQADRFSGGNLTVNPITLPNYQASLREKIDYLTGPLRAKYLSRAKQPSRTRVKVRKKITAARLKEYRDHQKYLRRLFAQLARKRR